MLDALLNEPISYIKNQKYYLGHGALETADKTIAAIVNQKRALFICITPLIMIFTPQT
jgi:hypothetical protein